MMSAPTILRPGETCWRIETADRLGVIVDAADYFIALREVLKKAQHSVIMIGWEFDTRIALDARVDSGAAPNRTALAVSSAGWSVGVPISGSIFCNGMSVWCRS